MKKTLHIVSALCLLLVLSCEVDKTSDSPEKCVYKWRSGDWETNYGYVGSGVMKDVLTNKTIAFQGTFHARELNNGKVEFGVDPFGGLIDYSFGWSHVWEGKSNCTTDFLISTDYNYSNGLVDLTANWNNHNRIEVLGDYYQDDGNGGFMYAGTMYFISN